MVFKALTIKVSQTPRAQPFHQSSKNHSWMTRNPGTINQSISFKNPSLMTINPGTINLSKFQKPLLNDQKPGHNQSIKVSKTPLEWTETRTQLINQSFKNPSLMTRNPGTIYQSKFQKPLLNDQKPGHNQSIKVPLTPLEWPEE